jgi:hypothetical protein
MVGNDVVDLRDRDAGRADADWVRFDARVFADSERALVTGGAPRARWRLWAAKEAAYKLARKLDARTVFSPPRFVVRLGADGAGLVEHGARCFEVVLSETAERVHAVARTGRAVGDVAVGLVRLPDGHPDRVRPGGPSRAVRRLACDELACRLDVSPADLEVRTRDRIPELWCRGRRAPVDLSLSHHGGWVAFAALLPERAA